MRFFSSRPLLSTRRCLVRRYALRRASTAKRPGTRAYWIRWLWWDRTRKERESLRRSVSGLPTTKPPARRAESAKRSVCTVPVGAALRSVGGRCERRSDPSGSPSPVLRHARCRASWAHTVVPYVRTVAARSACRRHCRATPFGQYWALGRAQAVARSHAPVRTAARRKFCCRAARGRMCSLTGRRHPYQVSGWTRASLHLWALGSPSSRAVNASEALERPLSASERVRGPEVPIEALEPLEGRSWTSGAVLAQSAMSAVRRSGVLATWALHRHTRGYCAIRPAGAEAIPIPPLGGMALRVHQTPIGAACGWESGMVS